MKHLGFEIHRLNKLFSKARSFNDVHATADRLTDRHAYLLRYLYENRDKEIYQRDIEKQFSISRSTVTVTLQIMEKNGLIRRACPESDNRLKRITLTQRGMDLQQQVEAEICDFEKKLTQGFTEEEIAVFLSCCEKMCQNLGEICCWKQDAGF